MKRTGLAMILAMVSHFTVAGGEVIFYCGTYTTKLGHVEGRASSIGIYSLNLESGEIHHLGESPPIVNSSHLCLGPQNRYLYSISEYQEFQGKRDGYLTVFARDRKTHQLRQLQTISSQGPGPAYVSLDRSGKYLLLANYVAGNVVTYPIESDGQLGNPAADMMHAGSSVNPARQEGPHPHAIVASPDNQHVYVPDLGTDRIVAYRFDAASGGLRPTRDLDVITAPGSGPRHLVFAPSGKWAFVSLELSSEVLVLRYDGERLTALGRYSTVPEAVRDENTTAEIRISPDGKHVYCSNRGHNSLTIFRLDESNGVLQKVDTTSTLGEIPRNFGISPDGKWVIAANQNSHSLVSYRRDATTGRLTFAHQVDSPSPVLICFVEPDAASID